MTQAFNKDEATNPNEKFHIGDEINVTVLKPSESTGLTLTIPVLEVVNKIKDPKSATSGKETSSKTVVELVPGTLITTQIKSIKG